MKKKKITQVFERAEPKDKKNKKNNNKHTPKSTSLIKTTNKTIYQNKNINITI